MQTCATIGCAGHLGKFSSCVDEAIYADTLDGWGRETGSVEYEGHFTLVTYEKDTTTDVDGTAVTIPAGHYIVMQSPAGWVDVTRYDTLAEAETVLDRADEAYAKWSDED